MKKFFLVIVLVMFSMPALATSTLTCTQTNQIFGNGHGYKTVCTVTADSGGTTFNTLLLPVGLGGQYLYMLITVPGGTAPTVDTDLVINMDSATGPDILGGSGANMVDNATTNAWRPTVNSVAASVPIYGDLYVGVSNNSVTNATFTLYLLTVPQIP